MKSYRFGIIFLVFISIIVSISIGNAQSIDCAVVYKYADEKSNSRADMGRRMDMGNRKRR